MTAPRSAALFAVAAAVALAVAFAARDTPGYVVRQPDGSYLGDITHYVYWTRLVTLGGIQDAYRGTWPETYAVYPPVTLYAYQLVGTAYRWFEDPTFDPAQAQASVWLRRGIKAAALAWHLLAAVAIYLLVRRATNPRLAALAGALYVANPAALFDVAHWAQPDGAHSLFSVLAIGWLGLAAAAPGTPGVRARLGSRWGPRLAGFGYRVLGIGYWVLGMGRGVPASEAPDVGPGSRHPRPASHAREDGAPGRLTSLAWGAMALAALAKPQAWVLLPLAVLATWRETGARGLVRGAAAGGAVTLVVLLPFIATGGLGELATLPATISGVMPVVTANADNLWWLVLDRRGIEPLFTDDSARLVGPLTYRLAAGGLVGAALLFTYWLYWTDRARLAEAAALGALGWFVFTTQAHENHLFFTLPLLSLAWPQRPRLLVPFAVLTATVLLNMALHDELLLETLGLDPGQTAVRTLRNANAVVNVGTFVGWSLAALRRRPQPAAAPSFRHSRDHARVESLA